MNPKPKPRYLGSQAVYHGPWEVTVDWAELGEGWPEPVGLTIRSFDQLQLKGGLVPAVARRKVEPLTATLLHDLAWRQKFDESLQLLRGSTNAKLIATPRGRGASEVQQRARSNKPTLDKQKKRKAGRPKLYGPEHYQEVAKIYRFGGSKRTQAVVKHYKYISRSTAGRWVRKAQELGFIGPAKTGTAGQTRRGKKL